LFQKRAYVEADLPRIRLAEFILQIRDDLSKRALAIAALEHLSSRPLQFDSAFGE
jgi:hypothetical protein